MPDIDTPYNHNSGDRIVISQGIGGGENYWMAFRRNAGTGSLKRISSPKLPCRKTPEEVIADLRKWMGCPTEKRMIITAEVRSSENGLEHLCRYENPEWPAPREYWFPETALAEETANIREFGYAIVDERAAPAHPQDPPPPSPEPAAAQGEGPGGVSLEILPTSTIRTDGGTQVRVELSAELIDDYAAAIRAGDEFPPIVVYHDGENFWLADGFHRLLAAVAAGQEEIAAVIREGGQRDALLYAIGANATHGQRRANADKRNAVLLLLSDHEWSQWSDREIARRAAVSHPFVAEIRQELTGNVSSETPSQRTYTTKHGTVSTMRTDNIGQAPAAPPAPSVDSVGAHGGAPSSEQPASEPKPSQDSIAIADAIMRDIHEINRHARRDNLSQEESERGMRDIISVHVGKALKEVRAYSYKLLLDTAFSELGLPPDRRNLDAARARIQELRQLETLWGNR